MPKTLSKEEKGATETYAKFVAEPFAFGELGLGRSELLIIYGPFAGAPLPPFATRTRTRKSG